MRSERELMLAGELYDAFDAELVHARTRARGLTRAYGETGPEEAERRTELLRELLADVGENVIVEPPFFCDYGWNISLGDGTFLNFDCVFLDCNRIVLGRNVLVGPGVHVYAATHPVDVATRRTGRELALPVAIGDDVWIGGGAIVGPGVTIGSGTTIGAGSVVLRDVPDGVVAAGNPCRVLRGAS